MSGNYEQSRTEKNSGKRNSSSRKAVFQRMSDSIIRSMSEEAAVKRELERQEILGKGKYIMNGSNDRVNGETYNVDLYQDDKKSYHYGYITHGGKRLFAVIDTLEKEGKFDEIMSIGYRDYTHGIQEDALGMLKQNAYYMEGYNASKVEKKGR